MLTEKKPKMTLKEFEEEVREFIYYHASDYANASGYKINCPADTEDPYDFEADVELEFAARIKWSIPIGFYDGRAQIAASPDCDCYLSLDGEGLFTYLFFEAERKLRDIEDRNDAAKAAAKNV